MTARPSTWSRSGGSVMRPSWAGVLRRGYGCMAARSRCSGSARTACCSANLHGGIAPARRVVSTQLVEHTLGSPSMQPNPGRFATSPMPVHHIGAGRPAPTEPMVAALTPNTSAYPPATAAAGRLGAANRFTRRYTEMRTAHNVRAIEIVGPKHWLDQRTRIAVAVRPLLPHRDAVKCW